MKYIAIVDDEFISNFRVDVGEIPHSSNIVLVVKDERGFERGVRIQPIGRAMIVSSDGNSAYLNQEHIDYLIEMERKNMFNEAVKNMINSFRREDV